MNGSYDFVLDGSVALSWCFEDEASEYADCVLRSLTVCTAIVPSLWPLEVANVLLIGERRGRCTQADTAHWTGVLKRLPISYDDATAHHAFDEVVTLGRAHAITAYDAAYLELALRMGLPLATLDAKLRPAAAAAGVPIYEPT